MAKLIPPIVAILLAAAAALLHWGPVTHYVVECQHTSGVTCTIERSKASGSAEIWRFQLSPDATAFVRVIGPKGAKGKRNTYLYLRSDGKEIFAAQFEAADAVRDAEAAAQQLNHVFHSDSPATARIEVRPPAHLRWMSWGMLGVMALLIGAMGWKVYFCKKSSASQPKPIESGA